MVAVPVDGVGQAVLEVGEPGLPAELVAELARVDGVAQVVPGPVGDLLVGVPRLPEQLEDQTQHLTVVLLAVGTDQVGLAAAATLEDGVHRGVVVVDVDPVEDVLPRAVELGPASTLVIWRGMNFSMCWYGP